MSDVIIMERLCINKSRWDGSSTDVLCLTEAMAFPNSKDEGRGGDVGRWQF